MTVLVLILGSPDGGLVAQAHVLKARMVLPTGGCRRVSVARTVSSM